MKDKILAEIARGGGGRNVIHVLIHEKGQELSKLVQW